MEIIEEFVVAAPRPRVFAQIVSVEGMRLFTGFGLIPGIARVEPDHPARVEGATDTVYNLDGTHHRERVTALRAPRTYALHIGAFASPLRHLVAHLEERWDLDEVAAGTRVRRAMRLAPRGWLRGLVVRLLLAPQLRVALRRNHAALIRALGVAAAPGDDGRRGSAPRS